METTPTLEARLAAKMTALSELQDARRVVTDLYMTNTIRECDWYAVTTAIESAIDAL